MRSKPVLAVVLAAGLLSSVAGCGGKGITKPNQQQQQYTLTITTAGTGSGTTTPAVGQHVYAAGTQVTIQAVPGDGCTVKGWSNGATGSTCTVTMNQDQSVSVTFDLTPLPNLQVLGHINPGLLTLAIPCGFSIPMLSPLIQITNSGQASVNGPVRVDFGCTDGQSLGGFQAKRIDVGGEHQQAGEALAAFDDAELGRLLDRVDGVAAGIGEPDHLGFGRLRLQQE